jgi:hypothetical protein
MTSLVAFFGGLAVGWPIDMPAQQAAIAHARALSVRTLEPALPSVRLDEWLERLVGAGPLEWSVTDCDLKSNSRQSAEDRLLCIGAAASKDSYIYLRFHLLVGNWARGVTGTARVLPQSFAACSPFDHEATHSMLPFGRLADLPAITAQLRSVCRREE